ncbi:aspartate/glutamate racemase family protein [Comamonas endophytica]|uniref:Aspartate/glutamate racemase family protein n=1 Tax=Comamonas endophytica TaxID=2949090 RepID=A0ABY6GH28_9BURK|nr:MULTISPECIES: aspartate/glutamate racemase family protein [unclassified Acidovorax]MCD2513410.1 aspartate/glutamate racemase family protein [Acidovorax sp. D4N7]UYG53807.1 aspartate/glutamate racemase family protein [Acidovorax sp. 5MLIR]
MRDTLYVINPNSSQAVTAGIDAAMEPLRRAGGPRIECVTLADGPPGVQTQQDVDRAALSVLRFAQEHQDKAAGFVTACFSDPGLHMLRELPGVLSLGISECGALTAMTLGQRFGVVAILQGSIGRHWRTWGAMGITQRVAGEVAIGRGVTELTDREATLSAMIAAGKRLRDEHGANVLVMGCAGMAAYRAPLQDATGLPVVEPTQAAASMALGRIQLDW